MKSFGRRGVAGTGVAKLALGIPLALLALAAWVVAISGVSVVRHEAGSDDVDGGLGFSWFVISATAFVLFFALIYLVGAAIPFIADSYSAIVGLLAVVTVLDILETEKWDGIRKATPYSTKIGKGAVTAFSGFLALATLNALLILVLGNSAALRRREPEAYASNVHHNPVGTHTHTGAAAPVATTTAV